MKFLCRGHAKQRALKSLAASDPRLPEVKYAEHQTPRKHLQMLKDSIANASTQLRVVKDELHEIDSFVFVCIAALRTKGGDDVGPDVTMVLGVAYEKLVLDVNQHIRDILEALGQDDGK